MDTTITFTPSELVAFIGTIAGVCAGIATITGKKGGKKNE